jgi:predicted O-linked N-acetylglucosamine transferase (SPINDLY family)
MDLRPILDELRAGRPQSARAALEQAIANGVDGAPARALLARACLALDDLGGARQAIAAALRLDANFAPAWIEAAMLARRSGALSDAAAALERACTLAPRQPGLALDLATTLVEAGRADAAHTALVRASNDLPQDPRIWRALAELRQDLGEIDGEIAARQRVAELAPHDARVCAELGDALRRDERGAAARNAFALALQREPGNVLTRWLAMQTLPSVCANVAEQQALAAQWSTALAEFEHAPLERLSPDAALAVLASTTNFYRHYLGGDLRAEQERYGAVLRRLARSAFPTLVEPTARAARKRPRIGFVSSHFHRHTVMKLFGAWLGALSPQDAEVFAFHLDTHEDQDTAGARGQVAHFIAGARSIEQWVDTVRAAELDVLVHWDVGMHPYSQVLSALRLAPCQAVAWGHPITTGLDTIDYFLSAAAMEGADAAMHYREQLVRLPNLGIAYARPTAVRDYRVDLPAGARGYLFCAQSAQKLHPGHDALFVDIARACPEFPIVLIPHNRAHVREALAARLSQAFAAAGLDAQQRVRVLPSLTLPQFLAVAHGARAALDSLDWSGGNTSLEILHGNVPVVTLPGTTLRSRHTAGMYALMDHHDNVVADTASYVRRVAELAHDDDAHAATVRGIAARKAVLYDDQTTLRALRTWLLERAHT